MQPRCKLSTKASIRITGISQQSLGSILLQKCCCSVTTWYQWQCVDEVSVGSMCQHRPSATALRTRRHSVTTRRRPQSHRRCVAITLCLRLACFWWWTLSITWLETSRNFICWCKTRFLQPSFHVDHLDIKFAENFQWEKFIISGEKCYLYFVDNLFLFPTMKNNWRVIAKSSAPRFFDTQCSVETQADSCFPWYKVYKLVTKCPSYSRKKAPFMA